MNRTFIHEPRFETIEEQDAAAKAEGREFACWTPEAPFERGQLLHTGCRACILAVEAHEAVTGQTLRCGDMALADHMRLQLDERGVA